jgi:DNA invertase Pin-like site-specific DNA recombinase
MPDPSPVGHVYGYTRVSLREAETGSLSLDWQRDQIRAWLQREGRQCANLCIDDGVSAGKRLSKRPYGSALVAEAVNRGDVILVAKLDRAFRSVLDFRVQLHHWHDLGVDLISCTESLDLHTPMGLFVATLLVATAEMERGSIAARTSACNQARRDRGLSVSGQAPYGWRREAAAGNGTGGRQDTAIVEDRAEQATIQQILRMRAEGLSLRAIAERLQREKVRTRHGRRWRHSTVQDILRDANGTHTSPDRPAP